MWKARRSVVSSSRSPGASCSSALAALRASSTTSRASSRKTSRISSSSLEVLDQRDRRSARAAPARCTGASRPARSTVATKSTSASDSSPRALARSIGSLRLAQARPAPSAPAAASAGWSAACASCDRRSRSRRDLLDRARLRAPSVKASICACSSSRGSTAARRRRPILGAALRPMTGAACRRRRRRRTATWPCCGCTLSMSIRKPSARQVAGEALEHAGRLDAGSAIDLGRGQPVDLVAHAQQRLRRLRPCRAPTARRASQRAGPAPSISTRVVVGVAEELVDRLLDLGAARRAAPGRRCPSSGGRRRAGRAPPSTPRAAPGGAFWRTRGEALAEALDALGVLGLVEVAVLERGLEVEQAGRDLHRQRRRRRGLRGLGLPHGRLQLVGERLAEREQAPQRIADQRELLGEAGEAVHLAAGRSPTTPPWPRRRACLRVRDRSPGRSGRGRSCE